MAGSTIIVQKYKNSGSNDTVKQVNLKETYLHPSINTDHIQTKISMEPHGNSTMSERNLYREVSDDAVSIIFAVKTAEKFAVLRN